MPLNGVRVIDFGQLTAGANTSAMLADLGADVIKIESPANLDLFRSIGAPDRDAGWWNRSPPFRFSNRNKRSIALDLKSSEGLQRVRELIAQSDVVVENFRRGVLERLALDYPNLRDLNPRIVLASISSQGETVPTACTPRSVRRWTRPVDWPR
jgi:crotonobetainyl-CoA:carnitine CoA-transferase CaiB-like acyl-CoA transferase